MTENNQNITVHLPDSELMFNVIDGFDVVIGNPPYINIECIAPKLKICYTERYDTFRGRSDVFGLFYEAAMIRHASAIGVIAFIVPQQITNNLSYKKLRNLIINNQWLREAIYLGHEVFESVSTDVCILLLDKTRNSCIRLINAIDFTHPQINVVTQDYFTKYGNAISFGNNEIEEGIFKKIFANTGRWLIKDRFTVFQGIVTGNDPAFIPTKQQIEQFDIEAEILKPILLGRDVSKWVPPMASRKVLYINKNTQINKFPNAELWLQTFKDVLENRQECREGTRPWYSLHRSLSEANLGITPKIVVQYIRHQQMPMRIVATMDEECVYGTNGVSFIIPHKSGASTYALLAVLNSLLINYLYKNKFLNIAIKIDYIKNTPMPYISEHDTDSLSNLAVSILTAKKCNPSADTSKLEAEIDQLVYQLYGLLPEEIAIVENSMQSKKDKTSC